MFSYPMFYLIFESTLYCVVARVLASTLFYTRGWAWREACALSLLALKVGKCE